MDNMRDRGTTRTCPALFQGEPAGASGPAMAVLHLPKEKRPSVRKPGSPKTRTGRWWSISAKDQAELETACAAFASLSYPLPDSPSTRVAALKLPAVDEHTLQKGLLPASPTLSRAWASAQRSSGTYPLRRSRSSCGCPPTSIFPNTFVSVILHMAYGAAMRSDSVLNIKLNGEFISGVRLDNPKGDYFKGYRWTSLFRLSNRA